MPFLLTLNPSQEQQARQYFSPASQPATPLAPQPAPVTLTPAPATPVPAFPRCGTDAQYNAARTIGNQIGTSQMQSQRFGITMPRFSLADAEANVNRRLDLLIQQNPSWEPCRSNMVAVGLQAASSAFASLLAGWEPAYRYQPSRG